MESAMKPSHKLSRRSFFASVAGGVLIGGGSVATLTGRARAQSNQTYTGVTDADTGAGRADRPGYGTGVRNRYTDNDTGPGADPQFGGRGPNRNSPNAPSGQGSYFGSPSYCSDSDSGPGSDPGGRGRRCGTGYVQERSTTPTHTRHCTDSDRGNNADLPQQGRRC
jgi:hypothetical protein